MTNAKSGLRTALARGASGAVAAIGELTAEDILGGISDDTRASLAASLGASSVTPPASADASTADMPDDEKAESDCSKCDKDKKDGKCERAADDADANADATPLRTNASVHERVKAVAASDAAKANPAAALDLLADDEFVGLSAEAVIKLVGKAAPAGGADDGDDATAAQILAAMGASGNSGIDAGGGAGPSTGQQDSTALWGKVHGRMTSGSNN